MPDPYEIIGVRRDASLDEIRIAYRRSAQVLHPDRFATSSEGVRSEAAHRMRQLNTAMEAIEDERADEASGTGTLGHVSFGDRPPTPAATPASTRPLAERRAAVRPPEAPAPQTPDTPARVEQPATSERTPEPATAAVESEALAVVDTPLPARSEPTTPAPAPPARELDAPGEPAPPPLPRAPIAPTVSTPPPPAAPRPAPEPESNPYSLSAERTFGFRDDDDDYDEDEPLARPGYMRPSRRSGGPSRMQLGIVGAVIVVALAVIAGYFTLSGGGSSEQTFQKAGAPFSFHYPKDFRARRLDGGIALNKPTYQVGFGIDTDNYLLASTYKLGFTVANDGSATGPKGQQLTPDQIDHDIDVTIAKLAKQAGFAQKGIESGSLGSLRARIYDYAKADGSLSSTFVVALHGKTEYYVTCQSSRQGEQRISKACSRVLATFSPST